MKKARKKLGPWNEARKRAWMEKRHPSKAKGTPSEETALSGDSKGIVESVIEAVGQ